MKKLVEKLGKMIILNSMLVSNRIHNVLSAKRATIAVWPVAMASFCHYMAKYLQGGGVEVGLAS